MSIKKCNYCGKPFNSMGTDICTECADIIDSAYINVRKYIYQNPEKTDYASILENTEIPEKTLNYLIDSNKLEISRPKSGTKCRICGAQTSGGSMCNNCIRKMLSSSSDKSDSKKERSEAKNAQLLPLQSRQD